MKVFLAASFALAISLLTGGASAQQASESPGNVQRHTYPENLDPPGLRKDDRRSVPREDRVLKTGPLAPGENDRNLFVNFLRGRNTGLIRLLPREVYENVKYNAQNRVNIRGGGAYYSFANLTHFYGYGSDIELSQNAFSVGFAGADYGMLTMLGDEPLQEISETDPRAQFISSYQPPLPEDLARAEARRFRLHGGVTIDGLNYQSRLPVIENSTYLLRSISYHRSDVLVAFRVVRRDQDGSIIIAWKLLKKYPTPELKQG